MTKNDYVIVLGDFGIWDNSKKENYNLDWLELRNFSTLFVEGNHSNYNILNNLSVFDWKGGKVNYIRPSIMHLCRGEIFIIENKKFFAFGGASSCDIQDGILNCNDINWKYKAKKLDDQGKHMYRIKGLSWWEEELPSEEEMRHGLDVLKENNNTVDYIITHSPSTSELYLMGGKGLYEADVLTNYLEEIKAITDYKRHLFGHLHINKAINDKDICLYEQIVRILLIVRREHSPLQRCNELSLKREYAYRNYKQ